MRPPYTMHRHKNHPFCRKIISRRPAAQISEQPERGSTLTNAVPPAGAAHTVRPGAFHEGSKVQLMENMTAALPFMDEDMRPFAERTLQKISPLTENEYAELAIFAADEV